MILGLIQLLVALVGAALISAGVMGFKAEWHALFKKPFGGAGSVVSDARKVMAGMAVGAAPVPGGAVGPDPTCSCTSGETGVCCNGARVPPCCRARAISPGNSSRISVAPTRARSPRTRNGMPTSLWGIP